MFALWASIQFLCVSPWFASALRQKLEHRESKTATTVAAGSILRGRYVLKEYQYRAKMQERTWSRSKESDDRYEPAVSEDFPVNAEFDDVPVEATINRYGTGEVRHLGTGSFGDVWRAYDQQRQQNVAIKILFKDKRFLTPRLARRYDATEELKYAKEECQTVIDFMAKSLASRFPEGAKHICQCFQEHISDAGENDPLFLVQEDCGRPLDQIQHDTHLTQENDPIDLFRSIIKQVLEGVQFLSGFPEPQVHHDLKLDNVVVSEAGVAKIIDFGAIMRFEEGQIGGICTPQYVPPEVLCNEGPSFAYDAPPYAFDAYSVGVMYWELLCGDRPSWEDSEDPDDPGYRILDGIPWHRLCFGMYSGAGEVADFAVVKGLLEPEPKSRLSPTRAVQMISEIGDRIPVAE